MIINLEELNRNTPEEISKESEKTVNSLNINKTDENVKNVELNRCEIKDDNNPLKLKANPNNEVSKNTEEKKETEHGISLNITADDPLQTSILVNKPNSDVLPKNTDIPKVKTVSFASNSYEKIGEDWKIILIVNWILRINYRIFMLLHGLKIRIAYEIFCSFGIIGYLYFYIYVAVTNTEVSSSVYYIVNLIIMVFAFLHLINTICSIYLYCKSKDPSTCCFIIFVWVKTLYYCLTIYISIAMISNNMVTLGFIFLFGIYATDIIHSLRVTFLLLSLPVILIEIIGESLIRLFLCKLSCPYLRPMIKSYTFLIHVFGQECVKDAQQCSICLTDYTENDVNLVVLKCLTKHVFHEKCIFEWIKKQEYCPICRSPINFCVE